MSELRWRMTMAEVEALLGNPMDVRGHARATHWSYSEPKREASGNSRELWVLEVVFMPDDGGAVKGWTEISFGEISADEWKQSDWSRIKVGVSREQVVEGVGLPSMKEVYCIGLSELWIYKVGGNEKAKVHFVSGKVDWLQRQS